MNIVAWVLMGIFTGWASSRMLRGPGALSIWDMAAGTIAGIIGGAIGRYVVYQGSYTEHWLATLMLDFIFGLTAVELVNLLPFTGRVAAIRNELGRGPIANDPAWEAEQSRKAA
ncbi:MAG TPA: hypothetical protein VGC88_12155 [Terriglobales bacterium]|jgi:hypothetical protein